MRKPDTILDEIHEIRRAIDEKTKGMTHAEINEYYRKSGEATAAKYGFKIYNNVEKARRERAMVYAIQREPFFYYDMIV